MADGLTRLMAPILSFTADELWRFLPGPRARNRSTSRVFPSRGRARAVRRPPSWSSDGTRLIAVREQVLAEIEPLRKDKQHRQLAAGQGRALGDGGRAGAARAVRAATCRCCSSCRTWSCGRVERRPATGPQRGASRASRSSGRAACECERCWRYVRTSVDRSGHGPGSATAARTPLRRAVEPLQSSAV